MATSRNTISFSLWNNWGDYLAAVRRVNSEMDFSLVVLEGMNAMQRFQREFAPVGETGKGPHGRIPRSIRPARIMRRASIVSATSMTNYGPAIFTNEGTGGRRSGGGGRPYFIPRTAGGGFWHPGIRGTHWWERGAERGSVIALAAFRRKIEGMLQVKGIR